MFVPGVLVAEPGDVVAEAFSGEHRGLVGAVVVGVREAERCEHGAGRELAERRRQGLHDVDRLHPLLPREMGVLDEIEPDRSCIEHGECGCVLGPPGRVHLVPFDEAAQRVPLLHR